MAASQPEEKFGSIDQIEQMLNEIPAEKTHLGNKSGTASVPNQK